MGCDGNTTSTQITLVRPNFKLGIDIQVGQQYKAANAFQSSRRYVPLGAQNVEILGLNVDVGGMNSNPIVTLREIRFDGKPLISGTRNQVINAQVFYTGNDSAFSQNNPVGTLQSLNLSNLVFDLTQGGQIPGVMCNVGKNYFWLAYTISDNPAVSGEQIDAAVTQFTYVLYDEDALE
jgi:hypothetical protein